MAYTKYSQHAPKAPVSGGTTLDDLLRGRTFGQGSGGSDFDKLMRRPFGADPDTKRAYQGGIPRAGSPRFPVGSGVRGKVPASRVAAAVSRVMVRNSPLGRAIDVASTLQTLLGTVSPYQWQEAGHNPAPFPDIPGGIQGGGWELAFQCRADDAGYWSYSDFPTCVTLPAAVPAQDGEWPPLSFLNSGARFFSRWSSQRPNPWSWWHRDKWVRPNSGPYPPTEIVPPSAGNRPTPGLLPSSAPQIAPRPAARPSNRERRAVPRRFRYGYAPKELAIVIHRDRVEFKPDPQSRGPGMVGRNRFDEPNVKEHKFSGSPRLAAALRAAAALWEDLSDARDLWEVFVSAFDGDLEKRSFREQLHILSQPEAWTSFDPDAFAEGVVTWYAQEVFYGRIMGQAEKYQADRLDYLSQWGTGVGTRHWGETYGDPVSAFTKWIYGT